MIPGVFKLVQIVLLFRGTTAYHMRKKDSSFKLAKTVKTDVTYFEASSACPCINPWENYNVPLSASTVECDSDQILVAEGTISGQIEFSCKPLNYGSELCRPWDMYEGWYSDGCLGDEPKPYCTSHWCYVDPNQCERPHTESTVWDVNQNQTTGFSYSYETCGNVDQYSDQKLYDVIRDKTLRVSFPGDSSDGYTLFTDPEDNSKQGSTVDLMYNIFEALNITVIVTPVSTKSSTRYSSSYTQCVHEVALNETDLCIGAFWTTSERLLLTTFTTAMYQDTFFMVTFSSGKSSFADLLVTPFKPFTKQAWLALTIVVLYMSTAISIVQNPKQQQEDEVEQDDVSKSSPKNISWYIGFIREGGNNFYYAITSFAKGEVTSESDEPSTAEKCIIAGFMLFALIVLTAYTASSAAALVVSDVTVQFRTIEDVEQHPTAALCIEEAIQEQFMGLYQSFPTDRLLVRSNIAAVLESMNNNECVTAIMKQDAYDLIQADTSRTNCDKVLLSDLVLTLGNAYPVRPEYAQAFTYAVGEEVNKGSYAEFRSIQKAERVGPSLCSSSGSDGGEEEGFQKLGVNELLAPILLTFLSTTMGLIVFYYPRCRFNTDTKSDDLRSSNSSTQMSKQHTHTYYNHNGSDSTNASSWKNGTATVLTSSPSPNHSTVSYSSLHSIPLSQLLQAILAPNSNVNDQSKRSEIQSALHQLPNRTALYHAYLRYSTKFSAKYHLVEYMLEHCSTVLQLSEVLLELGMLSSNNCNEYRYQDGNVGEVQWEMMYVLLTNPAGLQWLEHAYPKQASIDQYSKSYRTLYEQNLKFLVTADTKSTSASKDTVDEEDRAILSSMIPTSQPGPIATSSASIRDLVVADRPPALFPAHSTFTIRDEVVKEDHTSSEEVLLLKPTKATSNVTSLNNSTTVSATSITTNPLPVQTLFYLSYPNITSDVTSFLTHFPSLLKIQCGTMSPKNDTKSIPIPVLQIQLLRRSSHDDDGTGLNSVLHFFWKSHPKTENDNSLHTSFVLTVEKNTAKIVKEILKEYNDMENNNAIQSFVGKAGIFHPNPTSNNNNISNDNGTTTTSMQAGYSVIT